MFLIHDSCGQPQIGSLMIKLKKKILLVSVTDPCVRSGGRAGNEPGGGASSVQLQVNHLLLCPAAVAALLQRSCEDGQTATHLGAHIHVRGRPERRPNELCRGPLHRPLTFCSVLQDNVPRTEGL